MNISFTLKDDGIQEFRGVAMLTEDFLVFDIQRKNSIFGTKELSTIKVEYGALEDVQFGKNFYGDRIKILPKDREFFKHLPQHYFLETEFILKTKKKERDLAKLFCDQLEDKILFQRS